MVQNKTFWKMFFACGLAVFFAGCSSVLSDRVLEQSEPAIPFQDIQNSTGIHTGKMVILGGTIIKINHESSGSVVEILQRPLGHRLKPESGDQTGGRFLVRANRVIEDQIFRTDRLVTVAGNILGRESRTLDETTYDYPVISLEEYHLWPEAGPYEDSNPRVFLNFGIFGTF